jgi:hypothetical protein
MTPPRLGELRLSWIGGSPSAGELVADNWHGGGAMRSKLLLPAWLLLFACLSPLRAQGEGAPPATGAPTEAPLRIEIVEDRSFWRWFVFSDEQRYFMTIDGVDKLVLTVVSRRIEVADPMSSEYFRRIDEGQIYKSIDGFSIMAKQKEKADNYAGYYLDILGKDGRIAYGSMSYTQKERYFFMKYGIGRMSCPDRTVGVRVDGAPVRDYTTRFDEIFMATFNLTLSKECRK